MPNVRVNGADIHYEEHGTGSEAVVFAHGLLFDKSIFADQIAALEGRYRCIAFDFRGQGKSEVTRSGYDMDTLSDDAAALIEAVCASPCHFVGLSMGGFVGLRLAIRRPALLRSLILFDTSADPERPLDRLRYRLLAFVARWFGFRPVINRVMRIMFSEKALRDPSLMNRWRERILANDRIGVTRAVGGVIGRAGVYDELESIALPTLVVGANSRIQSGTRDRLYCVDWLIPLLRRSVAAIDRGFRVPRTARARQELVAARPEWFCCRSQRPSHGRRFPRGPRGPGSGASVPEDLDTRAPMPNWRRGFPE